MGEVYRARDPSSIASRNQGPAARSPVTRRLARFTREAQTLAALNHPNIAQIYGVEEAGGEPALVMELVTGDDLSALVARGPIRRPTRCPSRSQIAEALEAAHEQGIVHRDSSPPTSRCAHDGTVKVLDSASQGLDGGVADAR